MKKRVQTEITHLVSDIKRVNPEGSPWCTFGELFTDPIVEQYYEALVGTLKAAKRKGVIEFKGQLLLKGMHDDVRVSLVANEKQSTCSPSKGETTSTHRKNDTRCVKNSNIEASTPRVESWNNNTSKAPKAFTFERNSLSPPICNNMNEWRVEGNKKQSVETVGRKKKSNKKLESFLEEKSSSLESFIERKDYSIHKDEVQDKTNCDDASLVSFATAPVFGSTLLKRDKGAIHTKSAGVTFHSVPMRGETHSERVERETNQLVNDIRRITPEGEGFCAFGDLFEDSQVEQYYEALVGTLKAAKRKGMLHFKGQMLFKGMHDEVQIDIVEA